MDEEHVIKIALTTVFIIINIACLFAGAGGIGGIILIDGIVALMFLAANG